MRITYQGLKRLRKAIAAHPIAMTGGVNTQMPRKIRILTLVGIFIRVSITIGRGVPHWVHQRAVSEKCDAPHRIHVDKECPPRHASTTVERFSQVILRTAFYRRESTRVARGHWHHDGPRFWVRKSIPSCRRRETPLPPALLGVRNQ